MPLGDVVLARKDVPTSYHLAVTVDDAAANAALAELDGAGLRIGECGAATLAALRRVMTDPECAPLRAAVGAGSTTTALLIATEGRTSE